MRKYIICMSLLGPIPANAQNVPSANMYGLTDLWAVCPVHGDERVSGKYWLELTPGYRSAQAIHLQITPLDSSIPFSPIDTVKNIESGDVKLRAENGETSVLVSAASKGAAILMTVIYKGIVPVSVDASIIYNNRIFASDCIVLNQRERSKS